MPNMGYVRFQNTYKDLKDCYNHMEDCLSEDEENAKQRLIDLCGEIYKYWYVDEKEMPDA